MNELTPERLAAIKDRIADYPEANMPNDDLPLLVAEVERLTAEFNRQAAIGELLDADAENKIDRLQSALSAAEKRIEELEKGTAELKRSATWLVNELRRKAPADIHMLASVCAVEDALSIPPQ